MNEKNSKYIVINNKYFQKDTEIEKKTQIYFENLNHSVVCLNQKLDMIEHKCPNVLFRFLIDNKILDIYE